MVFGTSKNPFFILENRNFVHSFIRNYFEKLVLVSFLYLKCTYLYLSQNLRYKVQSTVQVQVQVQGRTSPTYDYQTNEMTRTLYRIQSEFLLELYKSKTEFWTVRTDIFEDVSDHWDDKDDEELAFMQHYGMSSAIQFQTQRIIPAMRMETLFIDESYVPDEGEDIKIRIVT